MEKSWKICLAILSHPMSCSKKTQYTASKPGQVLLMTISINYSMLHMLPFKHQGHKPVEHVKKMKSYTVIYRITHRHQQQRQQQQSNQPTNQPTNQSTNQTTKQPNNQTTKQPNNQTTKQPNNQTTKQTNKQTNKQQQVVKPLNKTIEANKLPGAWTACVKAVGFRSKTSLAMVTSGRDGGEWTFKMHQSHFSLCGAKQHKMMLPKITSPVRITFQGTNMSHLGKRQIIDSKVPCLGDMLVHRRVVFLDIHVKSSWWFQPIRKNMKILVKLDHFPKDRGKNNKSWKPPPRKIIQAVILFLKNQWGQAP